MKSVFLTLVSVLFLSACASTPVDMSQGSSGKATVFSTQYTKKAPLIGRDFFVIELVSVNGIKAPSTSGATFSVKPGKNTLLVKMVSHGNAWNFYPNPVEINFNAIENGKYVIQLESPENLLATKNHKFVVVPFNGNEIPVEKI